MPSAYPWLASLEDASLSVQREECAEVVGLRAGLQDVATGLPTSA